MFFLPIADRELRVSARNKTTHRLRILFALAAVVIAGVLALFAASFGGGVLGSKLGLGIFESLRWLAFIFACAAGTFLTADCLSEEKREGTLGLLFLTDLRGLDVVLGKLFATSLRTFYALLAIFPVMAFSFVLGGVAVDEFQHSLLAICNALFFSLALGELISVLGRDPHKVMTATLVAMVVFLLLVPLDGWIFGSSTPRLALLSPFFAFRETTPYRISEFWESIAAVHLAGWCFLAAASWLAPKTWHEKGVRFESAKGWRWPFFGSIASDAARRRWLEISPIGWIIARDRWAAKISQLALIVILAVFAVSVVSFPLGLKSKAPAPIRRASAVSTTTTTVSNNSTTTVTYSVNAGGWSLGISHNIWYRIASTFAGWLPIALDFWLAAHVCRFYIDGKRSGFLELLMVTPARPADIIAGHWFALRRLFFAPVIAQVALTLLCGLIGIWAIKAQFPSASSAGAAARSFSATSMMIHMGVVLVLAIASWCLGLIAIVWYSIWMGIRSRRINVAMIKTFCFVKVAPYFAVYVGGSFLFFLAVLKIMNTDAIWIYPVMIQTIFIGVNLGLIAYARKRARTAVSKWAELPAA